MTVLETAIYPHYLNRIANAASEDVLYHRSFMVAPILHRQDGANHQYPAPPRLMLRDVSVLDSDGALAPFTWLGTSASRCR